VNENDRNGLAGLALIALPFLLACCVVVAELVR
jgi:hypothetical protein